MDFSPFDVTAVPKSNNILPKRGII